MSGSNYGGANATIKSVFQVEIKCKICSQFVFDHINKTKGIQSVEREQKQLTVVQKLNPLKIRNNANFYKRRNMTAVMGLNIDPSKGEDIKMKKIIQSIPGYRDMSFDKKTRLVTVLGTISVNRLADTLAKKLDKVIKIVDLKIEGGNVGTYSCLNPLKMSTLSLNRIGEIVI